MKPLIILLAGFLVGLLVLKLTRKKWDYLTAGNIAMSLMMVFTSIGHFAFTKGMTLMLPGFVPFKEQVIYGTGILEILAAIGLLIRRYRTLTAWLLIAFFILILPANILAAINNVNIEEGSYNGPGTTYLLFRVPLQAFFIFWVYWFSLSKWARAQQNKTSPRLVTKSS